jgi:hypothetical protein
LYQLYSRGYHSAEKARPFQPKSGSVVAVALLGGLLTEVSGTFPSD